MTEYYRTGSTPPPGGESLNTEQDTAQLVKDQASDLADSSVQAGGRPARLATRRTAKAPRQ